MRGKRGPFGFTLIELMIVVAVIGTLAAVAVPKFSHLLRKSKEGATKGNLGRLRSSLSIYYGDMEGQYPGCLWGSRSTVLSSTLVPKYIDKIPKSHAANYHEPSSDVMCHQDNDNAHDGSTYNGWGFNGTYSVYCPSQCKNTGAIWMMCLHTDSKGSRWQDY